jgi:hypothetical protein
MNRLKQILSIDFNILPVKKQYREYDRQLIEIVLKKEAVITC